MASKETPKKVYSADIANIDPKSCRLCQSIGDSSHRTNIFKTGNRELLRIAEVLYGRVLPKDGGLPLIVCRPCERRLRNTINFQTVICKTQQNFEDSQSKKVRIKRSIAISPSIQKPSKALAVGAVGKYKARSRAQLSLDFGSRSVSEELSSAIGELRVQVSYLSLCIDDVWVY